MNNLQFFGAQYTRWQTIFTLWAPSSDSVILRLYKTGDSDSSPLPYFSALMIEGSGNVFSLRVSGDLHCVYYDYRLEQNDGTSIISADPWALAGGINGKRSMVVDLKRTDPIGWDDDRKPIFNCEPVIWETHVGDFSENRNSGIPDEYCGKYLAFTQNGTTLKGQGKISTAVDYLKKLGITHVQLQPVADFYTVNERFPGRDYNWGYDIYNYNFPEGSYSTDPYHGEVRIKELKQLVQSLHKAGIGVVLDVVYNHTYNCDSWLERTAPHEYYRYSEDGTFLNASGCGNETASERIPFRNYMVESVLYWAAEYHVDGFRFDLMGIHDVETMNLIRAKLDELPDGQRILMYGEPWTCMPTGEEIGIPADKNGIPFLNNRIKYFNDEFRNALAGDSWSISDTGYGTGKINTATFLSLRKYVIDSSRDIKYVSCHDNYALRDRLTALYSPDNYQKREKDIIIRTKFIAAVYLLAGGTAFFNGGEEFSRTKEGNGNSFDGPAALNALDWEKISEYHDLTAWYEGLIWFRRNFFNEKDSLISVSDSLPDSKEPGSFIIERTIKMDSFGRAFIAFNPNDEEITIKIPAGTWKVACDGSSSLLWKQDMCSVSKEMNISSITAIILLQ